MTGDVLLAAAQTAAITSRPQDQYPVVFFNAIYKYATALKKEVKAKEIATVREMLNIRPELVNARIGNGLSYPKDSENKTVMGMTPLHFAALYGLDKIIQILLQRDNGYTVSAWCRDLHGRTPLHAAAYGSTLRKGNAAFENNYPETCELLRSAMHDETKYDPILRNAPIDFGGTTPVGLAKLKGKPTEDLLNALGLLNTDGSYCPGDLSVQPQSPSGTRTGHSPMKIRTPQSRSPPPASKLVPVIEEKTVSVGTGVDELNLDRSGKDGEDEIHSSLEVGSLCYAKAEAVGWRPSMEDRIITACPLSRYLDEDGNDDDVNGWSFIKRFMGVGLSNGLKQPSVKSSSSSSSTILDECALFCVLDGHGGDEASCHLEKSIPPILADLIKQAVPLRGEDVSIIESIDGDSGRNSFDGGILTDCSHIKTLLHDMCMKADAELATVPALQVTVGYKPLLKGYNKTQDSDEHVGKKRTFDAASFAGSTLILGLVTPFHIAVANVGDSRCVLARATATAAASSIAASPTSSSIIVPDSSISFKAIPMSKDHKLNDEAERKRAEEAGGKVNIIGNDMYEVSPPENILKTLRMSRSFGDFYLKNALVDYQQEGGILLPPEKQIVVAVPDIEIVDRDPTDAFLVLACDGLWDVFDNDQAITFIGNHLLAYSKESFVSGEASSDQIDAGRNACALACDAIIAEAISRGSADNISVVIVLLAPVRAGSPFQFNTSISSLQANICASSTATTTATTTTISPLTSPHVHSDPPGSRDLAISSEDMGTGPEKRKSSGEEKESSGEEEEEEDEEGGVKKELFPFSQSGWFD